MTGTVGVGSACPRRSARRSRFDQSVPDPLEAGSAALGSEAGEITGGGATASGGGVTGVAGGWPKAVVGCWLLVAGCERLGVGVAGAVIIPVASCNGGVVPAGAKR